MLEDVDNQVMEQDDPAISKFNINYDKLEFVWQPISKCSHRVKYVHDVDKFTSK